MLVENCAVMEHHKKSYDETSLNYDGRMWECKNLKIRYRRIIWSVLLEKHSLNLSTATKKKMILLVRKSNTNSENELLDTHMK